MTMKELYRLSSLAIMGMGKNTGKTSFLNILIRGALEHGQGRTLAITSIGRDGEETDLVTRTDKPRIYIHTGTLVATAEELLARCDVTREIMAVTDLSSALGRVVIFRALSDGYVEIAGPSRSHDLLELESLLRNIENDCLFLVDGALSRMSFSTRTEGAVLLSGVSISHSLEKVKDLTLDALKCLTLSKTSFDLPLDESRAFVKNGIWRSIQGELALSLGREITGLLGPDTEAVYLRGAVTDMLVKELTASPHFRNLALIAKDGTRFLLGHEMQKILEGRGVVLEVLREMNIQAVIVNPYEPGGLEVDISGVLSGLREDTPIPVYSLRDYEGRNP